MSYQPPPSQDPNNPSQYGGYGGSAPQQNPPPTDPYSGQQYGQQGGSQQPGYQQPPYGQQAPYGQQQYAYQQSTAASASGPSSTGLQPNVAAGLSYLFVWVGGLVFFLIEKQNRFVRFHAMQSLIFFGSITILSIVLGYIPYISLLTWVLDLVAFVGWIFLMIQGFQGKYFKLPVIGDYAEKYANRGTM